MLACMSFFPDIKASSTAASLLSKMNDALSDPRLLLMQLLPSVERQTAPGAAGPGGYRMEVRGLLPPWVLDRLLAVLRDSQDGQFKVR